MGPTEPTEFNSDKKLSNDPPSLPRGPRFSLGRICITPAAMDLLSPSEIEAALVRHRNGDWGNVNVQDRQENDFSVANGFRVISSYSTCRGEPFWIITEADRSYTTILLPSDY